MPVPAMTGQAAALAPGVGQVVALVIAQRFGNGVAVAVLVATPGHRATELARVVAGAGARAVGVDGAGRVVDRALAAVGDVRAVGGRVAGRGRALAQLDGSAVRIGRALVARLGCRCRRGTGSRHRRRRRCCSCCTCPRRSAAGRRFCSVHCRPSGSGLGQGKVDGGRSGLPNGSIQVRLARRRVGRNGDDVGAGLRAQRALAGVRDGIARELRRAVAGLRGDAAAGGRRAGVAGLVARGCRSRAFGQEPALKPVHTPATNPAQLPLPVLHDAVDAVADAVRGVADAVHAVAVAVAEVAGAGDRARTGSVAEVAGAGGVAGAGAVARVAGAGDEAAAVARARYRRRCRTPCNRCRSA